MKTSLFIYILLCFITLISCSYYEDPSSVSSKESATLHYHKKTSKQLLKDTDTVHRGIYVNSFEKDILGKNFEETYLLNWCKHHKFNELTLYTVSSILNDSLKTRKLKEFVKKAHQDYHLKVSFVVANTQVIHKIVAYQDTQENSLSMCDGIFSEYEFWNSNTDSVSFEYFNTGILQTLKDVPVTNSTNWKENIYVYNFKDAAGVYSPQNVAKKSVNYLKSDVQNNRLVLVNYRKNAQNFPSDTTSSYYKRIQSIANLAARKKTPINVIMLYNTRKDTNSSLFRYLKDNTDKSFENVYTNFKNGFLNSNITNKEYFNLIGYQMYRYSDSKLAKPTP
ncbi:hypothetical protein T190115A13A_40003 [Tenacibaculum sp. 190524A02b]|uniref:Lipoprotein n=1 Tax=Tenacibaculum vairaonense TaxID=3137860 RepID=A0ABP1FF12_9FLAO